LNNDKAPKIPQYPGFRVERAVNGWILRETPEEYDERCSWVARNVNELQERLTERVAQCEVELEAGKLRLL
jgi:hypothetical protein